MAPNYLTLNKGGSVARLAVLRMAATIHNTPRPPSMARDWRGMRHGKFSDGGGFYGELSQGFNGEGFARVPVWVSHDGAFGREVDAHTVKDMNLRHTGWWCDEDQGSLAIGIVVYLPHGRTLAGYRLTMNNERVYFPDVYLNDRQAARAADQHAERMAEQEREFQETDRAQRDRVDEHEEALKRLRECIALRHQECMRYARKEVAGLIQTMRTIRDELRGTDHAI